MKKQFKAIRNFFITIFFIFFRVMIKILPVGLCMFFADVLSYLFYFGVSKFRKVAMDSLKQAFGENPKNKEYAKSCILFIFEAMMECMFVDIKKRKDLSHFEIENEHVLKDALAKGKGVVCVTAHLGNFAMMAFKLADLGYPISIVLRNLRNEYFGKILDKGMHKTNVSPIYSYPRKKAVHEILKALKENRVVIILNDQNYGTDGVWVDFFGEKAATATGPVFFAHKTKAALVPIYTYRIARQKHKIVVENEMKIEEYSEEGEIIIKNVAKLTKIIESWIRKYPHCWFWLHKRWKSRPDQNDLSQKWKVL